MSILEIVLTCCIGALALALIVFYTIKIIKNNYVKKVYETIVTAMKEAEQMSATGPEKKQYVLDKVKSLCVELKIPYDFIATLISKVIENILKGYNTMLK